MYIYVYICIYILYIYISNFVRHPYGEVIYNNLYKSVTKSSKNYHNISLCLILCSFPLSNYFKTYRRSRDQIRSLPSTIIE